MELVNSGQNFNIANITMEFLLKNEDNNLNNCYSYSLDEHLRNGEQSCNMPTTNLFLHNISKVKNQEVPFMIPGDVKKKFENFTRYINSKEHSLFKETMDHWNEMNSDYSQFLTTPKGYSDVSNSIASYLIGGFVGSKSQMNNEKHKLSYDLGGAIFKILHDCKCDKPFDKLREEKKFETNKTGKKAKSSTKENNNCFEDEIFCNNVINKSSDIKTNLNTKTSDSLIVKDMPTITVAEAQCGINENFCKVVKNQVESDKPFPAKSSDGEETNNDNHNDVDCKCLTSIVEPPDSTEEQISNCPSNEDQSVANNHKHPALYDTNNDVLETDEKSDASIIISLSPANCWSLGIRRRQYSECSVESTDSDSFIVFDDKCCEGLPGSVLPESENDESDFCFEDEDSDGNQDEDDDDDDDNDDDDDDDDDECCWIETTDECDNGVEEREIAEANARWSQLYRDVGNNAEEYERRVRFKDEVTIHRMVAWDYAYRAARPGPWEQMAHDRGRFKERIQRLGAVISPVLEESHRKSVYNKLYG